MIRNPTSYRRSLRAQLQLIKRLYFADDQASSYSGSPLRHTVELDEGKVIMGTKSCVETRWAQSCITSIGFPNSIDGVFEMLNSNSDRGENFLDLDYLLRFTPDDDTSWTAPKWLTEGDILFFYHTKRGGLNAQKLRKLAKRLYPEERGLTAILEHAAGQAEMYSGTIFGCASVSGSTEYFGPPEKHFDGRLFAPLGEVQIFETPLSSERFADYVKIGQNTITPVYTREAKGIRTLLAEDNLLTPFLSTAAFGDGTFRNVDKDNWAEISCLSATRFIHEAQLRSYLLDHFLGAIKDKGSTVLEECQCYRNGESTGIVDNFVKISGLWVPCEAKLSILSEKDIFGQVAKYMNIDSFVPTKGARRAERFTSSRTNCCLVVDQAGLYVISTKGVFIDCEYKKPMWKREQLGLIARSEFQDRIATYF